MILKIGDKIARIHYSIARPIVAEFEVFDTSGTPCDSFVVHEGCEDIDELLKRHFGTEPSKCMTLLASLFRKLLSGESVEDEFMSDLLPFEQEGLDLRHVLPKPPSVEVPEDVSEEQEDGRGVAELTTLPSPRDGV